MDATPNVVADPDLAAEPADTALVITRMFDAPRPLVFNAWIDPAQAASWWGPQGFTTLFCEMDVRVGGSYRLGMRSPEGTDHIKQGVYREITPPERLVFTYAWEDADGRPGPQTLVTVTFAEHGTQTKLTLHQAAFEAVSARDSHRRGWTSCMERFAQYLATL